VPGEEGQDDAYLADALVDVERAVARLEHLHLVRMLRASESLVPMLT
jgi:hypothetical protein